MHDVASWVFVNNRATHYRAEFVDHVIPPDTHAEQGNRVGVKAPGAFDPPGKARENAPVYDLGDPDECDALTQVDHRELACLRIVHQMWGQGSVRCAYEQADGTNGDQRVKVAFDRGGPSAELSPGGQQDLSAPQRRRGVRRVCDVQPAHRSVEAR